MRSACDCTPLIGACRSPVAPAPRSAADRQALSLVRRSGWRCRSPLLHRSVRDGPVARHVQDVRVLARARSQGRAAHAVPLSVEVSDDGAIGGDPRQGTTLRQQTDGAVARPRPTVALPVRRFPAASSFSGSLFERHRGHPHPAGCVKSRGSCRERGEFERVAGLSRLTQGGRNEGRDGGVVSGRRRNSRRRRRLRRPLQEARGTHSRRRFSPRGVRTGKWLPIPYPWSKHSLFREAQDRGRAPPGAPTPAAAARGRSFRPRRRHPSDVHTCPGPAGSRTDGNVGPGHRAARSPGPCVRRPSAAPQPAAAHGCRKDTTYVRLPQASNALQSIPGRNPDIQVAFPSPRQFLQPPNSRSCLLTQEP